MDSKRKELGTGKKSSSIQGCARSVRIGGSHRPSTNYPITNFFRMIPKCGVATQKNVPLVHDSSCDESVQIVPDKANTGRVLYGPSTSDDFSGPQCSTKTNKHLEIPETYRSFYPNMHKFLYNTCSNLLCKTCPAALKSQICNKRKYLKFCKVFNCVYHLKCSICKLGYVGQTSSTLNIRMNLHRSQSKKSGDINRSMEIEHFHKHEFKNVIIQILDIIPDNLNRIWWENIHISQFKSLYPYGLNTIQYNKNYNEDYVRNISQDSVYLMINQFRNPTKTNNSGLYRIRGPRRNKNDLNQSMLKYNIFVKKYIDEGKIEFSWIKNLVFSLRRNQIRDYWQFISLEFDDRAPLIGVTIMDLVKYRAHILGINLNSIPQVFDTSYCVINFNNKLLNNIKFPTLFSEQAHNFPISGVRVVCSFRYPTPVCRTIFNYNYISKNLNKYKNNTCICKEDSPYFDYNHNHVITGDLGVLENCGVRNLMELGTNYRLPTCQSKNNIINFFKKDIDSYVYGVAIKYSYPLKAFDEWKQKLNSNFMNLVNNSKPNLDIKNNIKIMDYNRDLKNLQSVYVLSYVDKVASNYAITCLPYYCETLIKVYENKDLYTKVTEPVNSIINRIRAMYKLTGLTNLNFKFPYLILIPKLHKNPIKFRSVTVGCNTYLVRANNKLLSVIKNIYPIMTKYGSCIVKNSFEAIGKINELDNITHFRSFDFNDLFNSISLQDLFDIMISAFEKYDLLAYITFAKYKSLLKLVLFETYLMFEDKIYKQNRGIPMGGGCSSALADIFLFTFESGVNLINNIAYFRFVDDLLIAFQEGNSDSDIDFTFYPGYLTLTENVCNANKTVNYLDISIGVEDGVVVYSMYNKRDYYKFKINSLTKWNSVIHVNVFRNILINHFVRCSRLNSGNDSLKAEVSKFIRLAQMSDYPYYFIVKIVSNFFNLSRLESIKQFKINKIPYLRIGGAIDY